MVNTEIRFRNNQVYLLKEHGMTVEKFEGQIKQFSYSELYEKYRNNKDEYGVEKTHFPAVNIVFYKYIFEHSAVLPPDKFVEAYLNYYQDLFIVSDSQIEYCLQRFDMDALSGRILRTYPSLIRDFDFYLLLCESQQFENVIYSCMEDINGKDIIIKHHGKEYIISLYVDTARSNYFKRLKNKFRHKYPSNEIRVPLKLDIARECGDFRLYSRKDVDSICHTIRA